MKRVLPRNRKVVDYGLEELWKDFNKENKPLAKKIGIRGFYKIIMTSNTKIKEAIIDNPNGVKLPNRLGWLGVLKKKPLMDNVKNLKVDWKRSKDLGYKIYHMNSHSDNFTYKIYWDKKGAILSNVTLYVFTSCRNLQRDLAKAVFKGKEYHLEKR